MNTRPSAARRITAAHAFFLGALLAALALLIVGGVFFLIRTLFDLDLKRSRWS